MAVRFAGAPFHLFPNSSRNFFLRVWWSFASKNFELAVSFDPSIFRSNSTKLRDELDHRATTPCFAEKCKYNLCKRLVWMPGYRITKYKAEMCHPTQKLFWAGYSSTRQIRKKCNHPASEASREIANLTERKNQHIPMYGVKEFVCLSVWLWSTLTPIIPGLAKQNGPKNWSLIYKDKNTIKII